MKLSMKLLILPALFFATIFTGCSKDNSPAKTGHRIKYKVTASAGSTVNTVVYIAGNGQSTTLSGLSVPTWESAEFDLPASTGSVSLVATGTAANATSTLKVEIYVDGVSKRESTATGPVSFGTSTTFIF